MNRKKLYLLFIMSMIIMPILVLVTEDYFNSFLLSLCYPPIVFLIIIYIYIKRQKQILSTNVFWGILSINIFNNITICFVGGILFSVLGMAHYDSPNITFLTHISFVSLFVGMMCILFFTLFYIFIKPFVNHLDKSIRKMEQDKQSKSS